MIIIDPRTTKLVKAYKIALKTVYLRAYLEIEISLKGLYTKELKVS